MTKREREKKIKDTFHLQSGNTFTLEGEWYQCKGYITFICFCGETTFSDVADADRHLKDSHILEYALTGPRDDT